MINKLKKCSDQIISLSIAITFFCGLLALNIEQNEAVSQNTAQQLTKHIQHQSAKLVAGKPQNSASKFVMTENKLTSNEAVDNRIFASPKSIKTAKIIFI